MAQLGLPSQQYNNNLNQINQSQASSLATAQRSSNPGAGISEITGQTDSAKNQLNAEDATARMSNERFYIDANNQVAGQKLQQQQSNVFDPYTQHYNEAQALRGAGMQNENSNIQDLGSLAMYASQYGLIPNGKKNQYKNFGGQWYGMDANGQYNPMTQQIPDAVGLGAEHQYQTVGI